MSDWYAKACDWCIYPEGCPLNSYPASVTFACIDPSAWKRLPPGRCVPYLESSEERNLCENPGGGSPNPTDGTNPIVLMTGAKYEAEEDFATADRRLVVGRSYRSFQSGGATVYQSNPLGLGDYWRLMFGYALQLRPSYLYSNEVTVHMPDGSSYDFRWDSTGTLVSTENDARQVAISLALDGPWPADPSTLTQNSTRWRLTLPDNRVVMLETAPPNGSTQFTVGSPGTELEFAL